MLRKRRRFNSWLHIGSRASSGSSVPDIPLCLPDTVPPKPQPELTGCQGQVDGGLVVAPLPIAAVPNMTVVARIRVRNGQPDVEAIFTGGYIEATASPKGDLDLPGRWVDWENRVPAPSWISVGWRGKDNWEAAGRPAPGVHTPILVRRDNGQGPSGWDLRLIAPSGTCSLRR